MKRQIGRWHWVVLGLIAIGLFVIINHVFYFGLFGHAELQVSYNYILVAIFLAVTFLFYPLRAARGQERHGPSRLDIVLFLISFAICIYFGLRGYDLVMAGWGARAPAHALILGFILWLLILEGTRRTAGLTLTIIVVVISLYPLFAGMMPGLLRGASFSFDRLIAYHILSPDSAMGIPLSVACNILMGYILFGVVLLITGGGDFFLKLALSLLGNTRGGVAKASVLASCFFGSLSGSAISNVVTTGSITIPMMKRTGYPSYFAAGVEACASDGGALMPPIMGAVAFVMASLLNVPYLTIVMIAIVPALLYYFGIFVQVDGRAVRNNLRGIPRDELPSIKHTLREGWPYFLALATLLWFLFFKMETQAPFYAATILLLIANTRRQTRLTLGKLRDLLYRLGEVTTQIVPVLCAVGMIIGAFAMTGLSHALPSEIVHLAGGNLIALLVFGATAAFILGMGMTAIAVYIFLAITLAPALVGAGLNQLAVHLFLLYWGVLAYITPPVCVAVYPAAAIADAPPLKSGWAAVRLGAVAFIIPFFFVLNPALLLQGPWQEVLQVVPAAFIGTLLIASSLEGYLIGVGRLDVSGSILLRARSYLLRFSIFASGFLIAIPEQWTSLAGLLIGVGIIILRLIVRKRRPAAP